MPQVSREAAFAALYTLLLTVKCPDDKQWGKTGRRLISWEEVPPANQPAFFLHQGPQEETQPTFPLSQWKWHVSMWMYFRVNGASQDQATPPDTVVNQFLDAVDIVLNPRPGERQTLGGLVYWCGVNGTTVFDSGLTDSQAVVVIPLEIWVGE